jgi:hypothetical protein
MLLAGAVLPIQTQLQPMHVSERSQDGAFYGGAMTDSDHPWEPPTAGTEVEHLVGALDRLRTT